MSQRLVKHQFSGGVGRKFYDFKAIFSIMIEIYSFGKEVDVYE
jgi:hypothetical protein